MKNSNEDDGERREQARQECGLLIEKSRDTTRELKKKNK